MANSSNRRITTRAAMLICIEVLTISVLLLAIITLVAGRFPHSIQNSPILTFDTSSVKTQLSDRPGNVQDWYELHYLSVCKGTWQSASTHSKNEASRVCTAIGGGYDFSLPELLAVDAGIPVDSALLSTWSFAVLDTKTPFICLVIAIAFTSLTMSAYLITLVRTPSLTTESPLFVPRVGYIASIVALNTLIVSAAKITAMIHKLLETKPVVANGVAWSTRTIYILTWLPTGLMCLLVILSVVLAFMLRPPTTPYLRELDKEGSGGSHVRGAFKNEGNP